MKILVALKEINRAEVYRRTYEDSPLGLGRLGLTGLAALVALLGLSANSAGIFIPALFFAALMGPMMGSALGLALQDWKLAGESAKSFGRGVARHLCRSHRRRLVISPPGSHAGDGGTDHSQCDRLAGRPARRHGHGVDPM